MSVRMWGAYNLDSTQPIDPQGNIFLPNIGPIPMVGVKNKELNAHVEHWVKRTYRSNVGVYGALETAQPVKVFVTGFVRAPGLYGGLSSSSILHFLDKAGGVDPDRGSYLSVDLQRSNQTRAHFDLYRFLLDGRLASVQLQDGDTLVVGFRQHTVGVSGEVLNPYVFEFDQATVPVAHVLALAKPKPSATHVSIIRRAGPTQRSESYALDQISDVMISDGDEITLLADKYPETVLVRIEGAHLGARSLIIPYGSHLKDVMVRISASGQANIEAMQLFRRSVATRQKELIDIQIRSLESYALSARSTTNEEAQLRAREAEQILQLIDRARTIEPHGQVVLASEPIRSEEILMEDGDVIRIPEISALVSISGEVRFPNTLVHQAGATAREYISQAGGFLQSDDDAEIIVQHQDGTISKDPRSPLRPGDEVMVLPTVRTKSMELARAVTTIIYQIAIAAKVVLGI